MNKIAVLPLLLLTLTLGFGTAFAEFGDHDITKDKNVSENPATADRKVSPLHSYGYDNTKFNTGLKNIVCGDHLCTNGEQPPTLSKYGDYSRGD